MSSSSYISWTFSFYVAKRFFAGFLLILAAVSLIILLVDFVELLRRTSSKDDVTLQLVLQMTVFKFPQALQKVIPFAILFGSMLTLWRLTRANELVAARTAGVSVWQFLAPAIIVAVLMGLVYVSALNPLGSTMMLRYQQMNERYIKGRPELFKISRSGMWLRQSGTEGQSVLHALTMTTRDMVLKGVTIYRYDAKNQFSGRLDAAEAHLVPGAWQLKNVLVTAPGQPSTRQSTYRLPTDWTPAKIKESFSKPETMSFWQLPAFIALLDRAGFTATRHRVYWYSLLAMPMMLAAMVLVAACFSLRMARRGGVAILITGGILFSFFLLFISDVILAFGLSDAIPAALAAWTPAAVTALIGMSILLHLEEG
ncbi:MAG: LPS export ABC transporter permease LptG [Alphaproteobacteria bacterium]|nr:LPS export ABC transporter permease LptG [Alphaproteobacteria bacterium]